MIGSAILFQNSDCGHALKHYPPTKINDTFAVSFIAAPSRSVDQGASASEPHDPLVHEGLNTQQARDTRQAREVVSKIAKLKVARFEFDQQAETLQRTNVVYNVEAEYKRELIAEWSPDLNTPRVPDIILDAVVAVSLEEDPGQVVASGPADATVEGEIDRMDADVEAAKSARYIAAFDPFPSDLNNTHTGSMEVTALMQQLEDLDQTAQRSVAAEVESALENRIGEGACLVDESGRRRILDICGKIRTSCARLDDAEKKCKLQLELQKTATGNQDWQHSESAGASSSSSNTIPHLQAPRASTPLSLWDWKIWTMARLTIPSPYTLALGRITNWLWPQVHPKHSWSCF